MSDISRWWELGERKYLQYLKDKSKPRDIEQDRKLVDAAQVNRLDELVPRKTFEFMFPIIHDYMAEVERLREYLGRLSTLTAKHGRKETTVEEFLTYILPIGDEACRERERLRAENESLRGSLEEWMADFKALQAEVERLKEELQRADDHNAYEEGLGGK